MVKAGEVLEAYKRDPEALLRKKAELSAEIGFRGFA